MKQLLELILQALGVILVFLGYNAYQNKINAKKDEEAVKAHINEKLRSESIDSSINNLNSDLS